MEFLPVGPTLRRTAEPYLRAYGEGSCQHSFASMYCLQHKYGDALCEKNGALYVVRRRLCTRDWRVYLAPMTDTHSTAACRAAMQPLFEDAHEHGAHLRLHTATENMAMRLWEAFPGKFTFEERRDLAEYIYSCRRLAELSGQELSGKRYERNLFYRLYAGRIKVEKICAEHFPAIKAFQDRWLAEHQRADNTASLQNENTAIELALAHYQELGLDGVAIFLDEQICGYAIGASLSDKVCDAMFEKGDVEVQGVYRVLNQEFVRQCCMGHSFVNREEDLGDAGLRQAKLSYKPDILLKKYVVSEV